MNKNSKQFLNTAKVLPLIKHIKKTYVYEQIGVARGTGVRLLRDGILPTREEVKERALRGLSELTGLTRGELLITYTKAAA